MKKIFNFEKFITEKVQTDWFEKNQDFYLSKNKKGIQSDKQENIEKLKNIKKLQNELKKKSINEIKFIKINDKRWINEYYGFGFSSFYNNVFNLLYKNDFGEYSYKFILAFINMLLEEDENNNNNKYTELEFVGVSKEMVNELFKNNLDYYGLCYISYHNHLYLTKNKKLFYDKIKEIKYDNYKIIYFNNKTKGKEITDYDGISINKIKNTLKNISYNDITFIDKSGKGGYHVIFKDEQLNDKIKKYNLISEPFFMKEPLNFNKTYFGHFKNRFHANSINNSIKGIGIGYKIYKAFLKLQGYLVSDEQTSSEARKIYYNLLKDEDVYYIIDKSASENGSTFSKDSSKILILWKDNPKLERIIKLIHQHELSSDRKYEYDKELLKFIK